MKKIKLKELDKFMKEVDIAYQKSHDDAYNLFKGIELDYPKINCNPYSKEYKSEIINLYKSISGRTNYNVNYEESFVDVEASIFKPYPYHTNSTDRLALYYQLLGKLMSMVSLQPGDSVLDMGCGWGSTSLDFANIGMEVTALDINSFFCELVKKRAELLRIKNIEILNKDFLSIEKLTKKYDAIIFFECFHHCIHFEKLLELLKGRLTPKGKVYFAAEPISDIFPIPWTLRLDGESLFVIRKWGWMELGFTPDFFSDLLYKHGFSGKCIDDFFWEATPIKSSNDPVKIESSKVLQNNKLNLKQRAKAKLKAYLIKLRSKYHKFFFHHHQ